MPLIQSQAFKIKNAAFSISITGASIAPGFFNLRLHHIILFIGILSTVLINKKLLVIRISKVDLFFLLPFLIIPIASGVFSGYLFKGIEALQNQALFFWTTVTWVYFLKYADQWSWKRVLYFVLLANIFITFYVVKVILSGDFYIGTTESSYAYLITLITMIYYRFSPHNQSVKKPLLIFNFLISLVIIFFLTTSRGALLGFICGLIGFSIILTAVLVILISILPYYISNITPYAERLHQGIAEVHAHHGTAADRYILWGKIFKHSLDNPFGSGAGSYRTLIGNQYIEIAESLYMEIMSAGGFILLAVFLIFLFILTNKVMRFNTKLALFMTAPLVMIATNPVGYHPIIPAYISIIFFTILPKRSIPPLK